MKKLYLCSLDRFGYTLTVIAETEEKGKQALMRKYVKVFKNENPGMDPRKEIGEYRDDETYYESAINDISFMEMELNKVEWL